MKDSKRWRGFKLLLCSAAVLSVVACGGGGGGTAGSSTLASGDLTTTSPIASTGTTSTSSSSATAPTPVSAAATSPMLGDCELFPSTAIFNTRIDDPTRFPAHPESSKWVNMVGASVPFSADFGTDTDPAKYQVYYGMPINVISGTSGDTNWPVVSFDFASSGVFGDVGYPNKSDCAVANANGGYDMVRGCGNVPVAQRRFPFPVDSKIVNEDGNCNDPNTCGDRHVLVVEQGACRLWETFFSYKLSNQWYTMATAAWDLKSLSLRPNDWASADAAGLPMTPLLAKTAEASSGEIKHALRATFRDSNLALAVNWPARFAAGGDNPGAIPFGAVMRLKADFVIPDSWSAQAKALATAAKRYGIYAADNGADFYVQGEPNASWNPAIWNELKSITMSNMEFVDLKSITGDPRFSPDSMAASW